MCARELIIYFLLLLQLIMFPEHNTKQLLQFSYTRALSLHSLNTVQWITKSWHCDTLFWYTQEHHHRDPDHHHNCTCLWEIPRGHKAIAMLPPTGWDIMCMPQNLLIQMKLIGAKVFHTEWQDSETCCVFFSPFEPHNQGMFYTSHASWVQLISWFR